MKTILILWAPFQVSILNSRYHDIFATASTVLRANFFRSSKFISFPISFIRVVLRVNIPLAFSSIVIILSIYSTSLSDPFSLASSSSPNAFNSKSISETCNEPKESVSAGIVQSHVCSISRTLSGPSFSAH